MLLRCKVTRWWLHLLAVPLEDPRLFACNGHASNVLFDGLTAPKPVLGGGRPQHRAHVLRLRRHVRHVGAPHLLVEVVDTVLEVGWVKVVAFGRLVLPEVAWLFAPLLVVLEGSLSLQERAETRVA